MYKIIKKFFCKHEFKTHGFTYVKCKKCGRVKHKPKLAAQLIRDVCADKVASGCWSQYEVNTALLKRDLLK